MSILPARNEGKTSGMSVYELIREDIIEGRIGSNERLKVQNLAARYGTSTNPVREALQQLRGEGFVVMTPNRGARVRPIDEHFVRDVFETAALLEPYFVKWFVGIVSEEDIEELEAVHGEIEARNFQDKEAHADLDFKFHRLMYDRHYNSIALELWLKHREILNVISNRFSVSASRRASVLEEHRALIACIKSYDAEGAARVIAQHVEGSGRHTIERLRAARGKNGER